MRELPRDPERLKHIILAIDNATSDNSTLNVPFVTDSNVPLQKWLL